MHLDTRHKNKQIVVLSIHNYRICAKECIQICISLNIRHFPFPSYHTMYETNITYYFALPDLEGVESCRKTHLQSDISEVFGEKLSRSKNASMYNTLE